MLLTKTFSTEQYRAALESWTWIGVEGKVPVLSSLFGDLFLQDGEGYWFLDAMEGNLTRILASRDEVQAALDSEEGQDRYLLGGLALSADSRGLTLGPNEVYDLVPPPVLGGSLRSREPYGQRLRRRREHRWPDPSAGADDGSRDEGLWLHGRRSASGEPRESAMDRKRRWGRRR